MSVRERPPQLYEMLPNAAGNEERLFKAPHPVVPSGWSRDGKTLFYTVTDPKTATGDIWSFSLETKVSTPVVSTPKDERYGTPSPDGHLLAYVSNDSDTYQVNVRALARAPAIAARSPQAGALSRNGTAMAMSSFTWRRTGP